MTGWTPRRVIEVLTELMEDGKDDRIRGRAAEVSARCLGMGNTAPQVNVQVGVVLSGRVSKLLSEALAEDADE
jgi:hypothetical protein